MVGRMTLLFSFPFLTQLNFYDRTNVRIQQAFQNEAVNQVASAHHLDK
jgi:hypothetical protein